MKKFEKKLIVGPMWVLLVQYWPNERVTQKSASPVFRACQIVRSCKQYKKPLSQYYGSMLIKYVSMDRWTSPKKRLEQNACDLNIWGFLHSGFYKTKKQKS